MELYVSEDNKDNKTRFLEILFSYLKIQERNIGKIIRVSEPAKEILKISKTPLLIDIKNSKKIEDDEIEIAKFMTTICGLMPLFFGQTPEKKAEFDKFINHVIKELQYQAEPLMNELNKSLLLETFITGNQTLSICDLLAFAIISPELKNFSNEKKNEFCNVLRWADHLQNLQGIKETLKNLKIFFSIPYEPFILTEVEKTKKKDKKEKKKEEDNKKEDKKEDKKEEKKESKKEEKKPKDNKKEPPKELHLMSKVDIRVGKIVNIEPNPEGDKLYNEQIDVGNGEIRKIASGLREHVPIEELRDSLVVVICNLQPRNLKGWPSHGMILCASKDNKVEPLRPPKDSQPGDLVYIGDLPREPSSDKKNPWSKVCNDLKVNAEGKATYKLEMIWKTDKGEIIAPTVREGGSIS